MIVLHSKALGCSELGACMLGVRCGDHVEATRCIELGPLVRNAQSHMGFAYDILAPYDVTEERGATIIVPLWAAEVVAATLHTHVASGQVWKGGWTAPSRRALEALAWCAVGATVEERETRARAAITAVLMGGSIYDVPGET